VPPPVGKGCASGHVCAPRASGDYAGYVCVEQAGDVACPTDWGARVVAYTGANDTRACTECGCTPGTVQCSGAEYAFWDGPWCTVSASYVNTSQCKNLSGLTDFGIWSFEHSKTAVPSGSCSPSGGQPTGAVNPTGAVTFCCRN
jgi:hypothetical protein